MQCEPRQDAVGHRDVAELAATGLLSHPQRDEDRDDGMHAAATQVTDLKSGRPRPGCRMTAERQRTGIGHVVDVVPGLVDVRAGRAVPADRGVDESWVDLGECVVADTESVHDARAERLDEHVGAADEVAEDVAALVGLEVARHRSLAPVEGQVRARLTGRRVWRHPADVVALARLLDLDDVGAEVGEHEGGVAPGQ